MAAVANDKPALVAKFPEFDGSIGVVTDSTQIDTDGTGKIVIHRICPAR